MDHLRKLTSKIMKPFSKLFHKYELEIGTEKISVPIRVSFDNTGKTIFSIEDYTNNLHGENADLGTLTSEIEYTARGRKKIEWRKMIRVAVEGRTEFEKFKKNDGDPANWVINSNDLIDVKVRIEAELLEIGTDTNGDQLYRDYGNKHIRNFHDQSGFHEGKTTSDGFALKDGTMIAFIEDTEFNRKALIDLGFKFDEMMLRLYQLLSPERITRTLETIQKTGKFLTEGETK